MFAASLFALILTAGAIGAMGFFGAIVAPTNFGTLDETTAGKLIRALFPRYYVFLAVVTGLAAVAALPATPLIGIGLALTAASFVFARQWLMPRINVARDREVSGDASASRRFATLYAWSVRLNMAQLVVLVLATGAIGYGVVA